MSSKIPFFFSLLLRLFNDKETRESLIGDYNELFEFYHEEKGIWFARKWIYLQILKLLSFYIKNEIVGGTAMIFNFIVVGIRNLLRHKGFSFINIAGLSLGMAGCILLFSFVRYQYSFDEFHKDNERIYRLTVKGKVSDKDHSSAQIPFFVSSVLKENFPQIESYTALTKDKFNKFKYKENKYFEDDFFFANKSVFDLFSFKLKSGNHLTVLSSPNSAVIDEETAYKYFGNENPIGKTLIYQGEYNLTITGILEKVPENSHLKFNILVSDEIYKRNRKRIVEAKVFPESFVYIKFHKDVDVKHFENNIRTFLQKVNPGFAKTDSRIMECYLQPLKEIHFEAGYTADLPDKISETYVIGLAALAFLILIIASVNYINLVTARASVRTKEIGIRKTLGSSGSSIAVQFIIEALLTGIISLVLGMLIISIFSSELSYLLDFRFGIGDIFQKDFLVMILMLLLFIAIFAGGYPAFMFSKIESANILNKTNSGRKVIFRNVLVTGQFVVLISLGIIATGVFKQLHFFNTKELGIKTEKIAYCKFLYKYNPQRNLAKMAVLKNELKSIEGIRTVSLSNSIPGINVRTGYFNSNGDLEKYLTADELMGDGELLNVFDVELVQGRNFYSTFEESEVGEFPVLINKMAAKNFGLKDPIGKHIYQIWNQKKFKYKVIGLVEDFHSRSLHHSVRPLIIHKSNDLQYLLIKLRTLDFSSVITQIKNKITQFDPVNPVEINFLDEKFNSLYKSDKKFGEIIYLFSIIALSIGVMGLLGLIVFIAERKRKEIAIRKVIGANIGNISFLLVKNLLNKIGIAVIIAIPAGYFILQKWIGNFAYKIELGADLFLIPVIIVCGVTAITIFYNVIKAAVVNPVTGIKSD